MSEWVMAPVRGVSVRYVRRNMGPLMRAHVLEVRGEVIFDCSFTSPHNEAEFSNAFVEELFKDRLH